MYDNKHRTYVLAICVQLNPNSPQKLDFILFKHKSRPASTRFWQDPPGCANRHLIHLTPSSMHIQWPHFLQVLLQINDCSIYALKVNIGLYSG